MTKIYYSRSDFAAYIGITPGTLSSYKLPEADVIIGLSGSGVRGWTKETIDAWQAARPGRGRAWKTEN